MGHQQFKGKTGGARRVASALVGVAVTAMLLAAPAPASAIEVALELSPGVAIPVGTFVDDFPLPADDISCPLVGFGFPGVTCPQNGQTNLNPIPGAVRIDTENDPGFALGLSLLLSDWEIRYNFQMHNWGKLTIDAFNLRLSQDPSLLDNVFFEVRDLGLQPIVIEDADELDLSPIFVHRIMLGYRFYVLDYWVIKPYIPVALGFVYMHGDTFDNTPGGAFEMGLGAEYRFNDHIGVSLAFRYAANIMKNPAIAVSGLQGQAVQAGAGGSGLFETAIEVFQTVTLSANAIYRF